MINYYDLVRARPEIFKQLSCKELLFAHYDCPLETNKMDNWSHYNYILYVVSGKKGLHTSDRSWIVNRKTAVFVKQGACIFEKFFDENLCLLAFFIPDDYLVKFLRDHIHLLRQENVPPVVSKDLVIPLRVTDILESYYESMIPYFFSENKPPEDLLELKFKELLLNTIIDPNNHELNGYLWSLLSPRKDNLQPILEANYRYNLKLEDYARLCNRSLSSFKRDFYQLYGTTPATWLLTKRLGYALQLLLHTDKPVNDISFESGFENSTHFSRVFKKQYGMPPLKYRLRMQRPALMAV